MNKLILYATFLFLAISLCFAKDITVFYEDFDDGDYLNSPTWEYKFGNVFFNEGQLNSDGAYVDESGRSWSLLNNFKNFSAKEKLILSYTAKLKSKGNPQEGTGIFLSLYDEAGRRYDLRIQKGYTTGFPINQYCIALGYGNIDTIGDYITTTYVPERDFTYRLLAIREQGNWTLYVNNIQILSNKDTLNLSNFYLIQLSMIGSVVIDNINVTVSVEDEQENLDLAKYAPILYLHPEEKFTPKEIESVLNISRLKKQENIIIKEPPLYIKDISFLEESQKYNIDLTNVNTDYTGFPPSEDFSNFNIKLYGREVEGENGYTFFQYFIFYPFQQWYLMNHEGDWEMIQVNVNPNNNVESVQYMFDLFTITYYDINLLNMYNKTHPPVLVGQGSHNNFGDISPIKFDSKYLFFMNLFGRLKELEHLSDEGKVLKPVGTNLENELETNYEIEKIDFSTPWINFEGRWGQIAPFSLNNGPKGPKYNPRFALKWREPEKFSYAPNIPFMSVFLYSPLDINLYDELGREINESSENLLLFTGRNEEPEAMMVTGSKNYTLDLKATGEGNFTLEIYYYDNETDQGIMVKYENISCFNETKARLDISKYSYFVLYLDEKREVAKKAIIPTEVVRYNNFLYVLPDKDFDTINDFIDNCIDDSNINQEDFNKDGKGDICDNPKYYKTKVLYLINKTKEEESDKSKINLAENALLQSLNEEYWYNNFEINSHFVFINEHFAAQHLNKNISFFLGKADKLILEKAFQEYKVSSDNEKRRFILAAKAKDQADIYFYNLEYTHAIINYMQAWLLLKKEAE